MSPRSVSSLIAPLILVLLLLSSVTGVARAEEGANTRLLLILDASGSMWGQVDGENKIVIARRVIGELINGLPDGTEAGLIAYGHRREGDCADIETIVPLGPLDRAAMTAKVAALNPKGKTPITDSLLKAFELVRGAGGGVTVLLVSDGLETCGGDPCEVVREAKAGGIDFLLHVVGFDVEKEDVSSLECAAQAGGGLYLGARNAGELGEALDQAVAVQAELPSRVSVKATADGDLIDAAVRVTDAATGKEVAGGRTYTAGETNPRVLPVPVGTFDISVKAVRFKGDVEQQWKGVAVADGETVEKHADFSVGQFSVKVTRNGELSDATVNVSTMVDGKKKGVAGNRSYDHEGSNPVLFSLTPGAYEVVVKSVEISGGPTATLPVTVESGGMVELAHEFASGTMKVGAKSGADLADAAVNVFSLETNQASAQGRTYAHAESNPKTFELLPGRYRVTVKGIRLEGSPKEVFELVVKQGEVVERTVEFAATP